MYIGYIDCFKKKKKQKIEITNECFGIIILYSYLLLANVVSDPLQRERIGCAIIVSIAGTITLNFILLVLTLAKVLRKKYKKMVYRQKILQRKKVLERRMIEWE